MYEIRVYKTREDFDARDAITVLDGFANKRDTRQEGKLWLSDHAIVKLQSDDREWIEILEKDKNESTN